MRYGKRKKRFGAYDRRFCDVEAMVMRNLGFGDQYGPMGGRRTKLNGSLILLIGSHWVLCFLFTTQLPHCPLPIDPPSSLFRIYRLQKGHSRASGLTVECSTDSTIEYSINCTIQCYSMKYIDSSVAGRAYARLRRDCKSNSSAKVDCWIGIGYTACSDLYNFV